MNHIAEKCIEFNDRRQICVAVENSKTYELNNKTGHVVRKVKVDGCLLEGAGYRCCDYLMNIDEPAKKRVFFIELKGKKLLDACEQISDTISGLKNEFQDFRKDARIVGSKDVPNIKSDPKYKKLARVIKLSKGDIKISTNRFYSEII